MRHFLLRFAAVLFLALFCLAEPAHAQGTYILKTGWSGPGLYFSLIKLFLVWVLFAQWVKTTDWINRDAQTLKLQYARWNSIIVGSFMGAMALVWLFPWFFVSYPLLLIAYFVPTLTYAKFRNKTVGDEEKILSRDHIKYWSAGVLIKAGVKINLEKQDKHEAGPDLTFAPCGGATERDDRAHMMAARQTEGMTDARELLFEGLCRDVDAIMLDFTRDAMTVRHMIDGVWHVDEEMEREVADEILVSLKTLCGLKVEDRKSRQKGMFIATFEKKDYRIELVSQGTKTGERVLLQFETETVFRTYDELGVGEKVEQQVRGLLALPKGMVVFAAPPAGGLRSTVTVALHCTDRFTREFAAIEAETTRFEEVENVPVTTYTPDTLKLAMNDVFLKEPQVVVMQNMIDGPTIKILCDEVDEERLIVGTVRAKDSADALLRVLAMKAPAREFASKVQGVVYQRLVRKLCEDCKEAYEPTPKMLQQLGIPEGRVEALYRTPRPDENGREVECNTCDSIGYFERTAIMEVLVVDDNIRKILASQPNADLMRKAARKAGMRTLQEAGIVLVAKGIISLEELMRVLKQ